VETGELHVGTLFSISVGVLPGALAVWRRRYPELQAHLVEFRHTEDLIAAMEAGRADVAVGPTPPAWAGRRDRRRGVRDRRGRRHRPADRSAEGAAGRSRRSRLGALHRAERPRRHSRRGVRGSRLSAEVSVRTEQSTSALNLVTAGPGIGLVPANVIPPHFGGRLLRPEPTVRRALSVYTRVRPDPITAAFVSAIAD
jgi:DNA-binding transcriptional LysR family regulator